MNAEHSKLTVGDILKGIRDTRAAIKRADALIEKASELGVRRPAALGAVADATFKLRDHLAQDLADLEKAIADAPR